MRRRLLGSLAWLLLLPLAGVGRLAWLTLRAVLSRPRLLLTLVALAVALSTSHTLLTAQLPDGVWSLGHVILPWALPIIGAVVLYHGARSPWLSRFHRRVRRHRSQWPT